MQIKMLTLQAGPQGTRDPGSIHDVSDKEAKALIEGGYAVEVKEVKRQASVRRATGRRGSEQAVQVDAEEEGGSGEA